MFIKQNRVYVIVSGNIIAYNHKANFTKPLINCYYNEGSVIGFEEKDNKITVDYNTWLFSSTNVEYLSVETTVFQDLWRLQQQNQPQKQLFFQ